MTDQRRNALFVQLIGRAVAIEMTACGDFDKGTARLMREAAAEFTDSAVLRRGVLDGSFPMVPRP